MIKWFICFEELVSGPLTTEQVKAELKSGRINPQARIWSRLIDGWQTLSWWESKHTNLVERHQEQQDFRLWHYAADGESHGPMTRSDLIQAVSALAGKNEVMVWTKGMPSWGHIYEFTDLMDEVGVSRRKHPRAEIKGSIVIKTDDQAHLGKLRMISAGGCGVVNVENLKAGQYVNLDIKSPAFGEPIRAKAEVRYVSETGFAGLRFEGLHMEAQAKIIEYVKSAMQVKTAA